MLKIPRRRRTDGTKTKENRFRLLPILLQGSDDISITRYTYTESEMKKSDTSRSERTHAPTEPR
jgi:hypothetical protein